MPTQEADQTRASRRQVDLYEAGARVGYAPESLRQRMHRGPDPKPPFRKVRGRWRADLVELDEWAVSQGITLLPLPPA